MRIFKSLMDVPTNWSGVERKFLVEGTNYNIFEERGNFYYEIPYERYYEESMLHDCIDKSFILLEKVEFGTEETRKMELYWDTYVKYYNLDNISVEEYNEERKSFFNNYIVGGYCVKFEDFMCNLVYEERKKIYDML